MSEHDGMKGAACLVDAQSVSSSSQVGRVRAKCEIRACISGRVYGGLVMIASVSQCELGVSASCLVAMLLAWTQRSP